MRWKNSVVGVGAALLAVALVSNALAFPHYALQAKAACAACHVNPAGGADLTAAGTAYKAEKKAPAAAAKASDFLGVNKCKMCHFKQYNAWKETKHASALANLRTADSKACEAMAAKLKVELKGSPAENENCVGCHVTGFHLTGGYPAADSTKTAAVSGVTCEACHGPGSQHTGAPAADKKKFINRAVSAKLCTQCHTPETSPDFKFDEMKLKVHPIAAAK
jgi:mono/diheme cytochrome c family protein